MPEQCNSNVVDLDDYRPHVAGIVKCPVCGHEWVGVIMESAQDVGMECSECGAMKGKFI